MSKECTTCGFVGDFDICPNDQTVMVEIHAGDNEESLIPKRVTSESVPVDTANTTSSLVGKTLATRYEILDILGVGGMGTVYLARQTSMNRLVAVKVLSPQFSQNPQMIRRFEKEANVVSKLAHPNTVAVFDYGRSDGSIYLVMERLKGVSLKEYLRQNGPLTPEMAVHIITQILRSLHQAHGAGIIHRDIKPANVFVVSVTGEKHLIKVLDFGVAKLNQNRGDDTVTQAGGIIGTPKYMAPEQARSLETDERADVYSVGVVLYELLTGRAPFDGDNPLGIMMDHAQRPLPPMQVPFAESHNYGCLAEIVETCLRKSPDERYPNAESVLKALDEWTIAKPASAPKSGPVSLADNRPLEVSRNVRTPVAPALVAFALIFAGVLWLLNHDSDKASVNIEPKRPEDNQVQTQAKPTTSFVEISIDAKPKAKITNAEDGTSFGETPIMIKVTEPIDLVANRVGFQSKSFTVSPKSPRKLTLILNEKRAVRKRIPINKATRVIKAAPKAKSPPPSPPPSQRAKPAPKIRAESVKVDLPIDKDESDSPIELD